MCRPFTQKDRDDLQFLYDEWAHPFFISKEEFVRLMDGTGQLQGAACEDWCEQTLPSWRQSIWVGVESPWYVIFKLNPFIWWKVVREIITLERMHKAFESGLMEYGVPLPAAAAPMHESCAGAGGRARGDGVGVWGRHSRTRVRVGTPTSDDVSDNRAHRESRVHVNHTGSGPSDELDWSGHRRLADWAHTHMHASSGSA